mmetsp:Transcript_52386/g.120400  ORF Transcript_52386/g.120400 Transcript_52386/m.120400 type:complete len:224 (-) Transcript_52386:295-966(-)
MASRTRAHSLVPSSYASPSSSLSSSAILDASASAFGSTRKSARAGSAVPSAAAASWHLAAASAAARARSARASASCAAGAGLAACATRGVGAKGCKETGLCVPSSHTLRAVCGSSGRPIHLSMSVLRAASLARSLRGLSGTTRLAFVSHTSWWSKVSATSRARFTYSLFPSSMHWRSQSSNELGRSRFTNDSAALSRHSSNSPTSNRGGSRASPTSWPSSTYS